MKLLVATYNIHRAVGMDGRCDIGRVGEVVHELAADVLGLQEVDCFAANDPEADHLQTLAARFGMHAVPGPLVRRERVGVGIAVLSRHPVIERRWVDLSVSGREPRGALDLTLDTPWGRLRVVNTHFGLRGGERAFQAARLAESVSGGPDPTIVLGDFNEWRWRAPGLRPLVEAFTSTAPIRSFPARRPLFALDRVFFRAPAKVESVQVVATAVARMASDHLPVRAILDLDAAPSPVL